MGDISEGHPRGSREGSDLDPLFDRLRNTSSNNTNAQTAVANPSAQLVSGQGFTQPSPSATSLRLREQTDSAKSITPNPVPTTRILLIGKGGREHALAWKLSSSPSVSKIYVCPGNGGTTLLPKCINIKIPFASNDYTRLASLAQCLDIDLVVVGPDDAVVDGIEGFFRKAGIPCFAPSKEAAELEGSKVFAKNFMQKYGIPTAEYRHFDNHEKALAYVNELPDGRKIVIKVDGLAAGKGVILPANHEEAVQALDSIMLSSKFGTAGESIVIEEYLTGDEISILTFCDGKTAKSLPPGQDHKRIFGSNKGPNTGGMGVYAPVPFVTPEIMAQIERTIISPTLEAMRAEGRPFVGMLFTGVMLTPSGPKVLEYNVRFGDPETQTLLLLLANDDLASLLLACTCGKLDEIDIKISPGYACNVVVAAGGYPETYRKGDVIMLAECSPGTQIFHAGTKKEDGVLKTDGGRVFSVAARGETLEDAVKAAYEGVECVKFSDMVYRKDIAAS